MRLEFAADVPRVVQLMRTAAAKQPGRKHNKRPGVRVKDRRAAQDKKAWVQRQKLDKRKSDSIRAYWAGESEENPAAK